MNILLDENFKIIKRDTRELKKYIVYNNTINDWDKIIIIYNIYLIISNVLLGFYLISYTSNVSSTSFVNDFKNIYLLFFILCSIKSSYSYAIYNISKVDMKLALSFHQNLSKYFV